MCGFGQELRLHDWRDSCEISTQHFKRYCGKALEAGKTTDRARMKSAGDKFINPRTTATKGSAQDVTVSTDRTWMKHGHLHILYISCSIKSFSQ